MRKRSRKGIAGLVLGAMLTLGAAGAVTPAMADPAPQDSKKNEFSINLNTPVEYAPISEVLYSGQNFLTLKTGDGFSAFAEINDENNEDGTDFFALGKKGKIGEWTLSGSLRVVEAEEKEDSTSDVALFAGRSFNTEKDTNRGFNLQTFGVYSLEDNFRRVGTWVSDLGDGNVQYDLGTSFKHLNGGEIVQDGFAGVHSDKAGAWLSINTPGTWGGVVLADVPGTEDRNSYGVMGFAKYDPGENKHLGALRIGSGDAPKGLGGQFDVSGGIGILRTIDQSVHPYLGNAGSFLEGSDRAIELGSYKNSETSGIWAQAGGHVGRGFSLAGGTLYDRVEEEFRPIFEAHKEWELKDGSAGFTLRGSDDLDDLSLNVTYSKRF